MKKIKPMKFKIQVKPRREGGNGVCDVEIKFHAEDNLMSVTAVVDGIEYQSNILTMQYGLWLRKYPEKMLEELQAELDTNPNILRGIVSYLGGGFSDFIYKVKTENSEIRAKAEYIRDHVSVQVIELFDDGSNADNTVLIFPNGYKMESKFVVFTEADSVPLDCFNMNAMCLHQLAIDVFNNKGPKTADGFKYYFTLLK